MTGTTPATTGWSTRPYSNAAGELFRDETELLEARFFGHTVGHNEASPP